MPFSLLLHRRDLCFNNQLRMKTASAAGSPNSLKNTLNYLIWLVKMNLMAAALSSDVQCVRTEVVEARCGFVARAERRLW